MTEEEREAIRIDMKVALLAIVMATCIASAQTNTPVITNTVPTKCTVCAGRGSVRCARCGGYGVTQCATCRGAKFGPEKIVQKPCRSCRGRDPWAAQRNVVCPQCRGVGSYKDREQTYCVTCNGRGQTSCASCRGARGTRCSACAGKGILMLAVGESAATPTNYAATTNAGLDGCQVCLGKGWVRCQGCTGNGGVKCPTCKGAQFGPDRMVKTRCKVCLGTFLPQAGSVRRIVNADGSTTVVCKECDGRGYKETRETTYCTTCQGHGSVACQICGGQKQSKCGTCGGNGRISVNR